MKLLITALLLSVSVFASDLSVKFEVVGVTGMDKNYFDSFEIKDGKFYATTDKMEREMGDISCERDICTGGPYLNDYDMPEITSVIAVLDSPTGVHALVFAVWDEEQIYQLRKIQN